MSDFNIPTAAEAISYTEARRKQLIESLINKIGDHIRISPRRIIEVPLVENEIVVVDTVLHHLKEMGYNAH